MNISATGTSSLSSLYLQQLLGSTGTSSSGEDAGTTITDLLTLSAAGQQASAGSGTDPFKADLASLQSTVASGDLAAARKAYQAMVEKMQKNGEIPADFAAVGKALESGDLSGAATALEGVQSKAGKGPQGGPPPQGANPLEEDMTTLGTLIQSGDLTSASTLFASILTKAKGLSTDDSTRSAVSALSTALDASDSSASGTAWETLMAKLQSEQASTSSSYAKTLESLAAAAYTSSAAALG
ncbi:hypothetical protein [Mesoterricola silvestris]|uniref:Uncharacterized protein n=1 Tax=Mesoterricola silvestris TaxID=2927979 RepID=A0AA48GUJ6_9BACT|nr:hypothetical protein [Mesoterricola silvestris]BDU72046.1 hypothetical protein METEAL_12200 [Mesoterricola silvestris]